MSTNPTTSTADAVPARRRGGASQGALLGAPSRYSQARSPQAITFGWRGMLKVKHVPEQLVDVTITPVTFVLLFTYLFGGAIEGSTGEYRDYILPGVLVVGGPVHDRLLRRSRSTPTSPRGSSTASARCRSGGRRPWWARCSATAPAISSRGP